ncbi:type I-B CRISPR-associated protein Cas8b1/Cst1 [Thermodesulfovibrio hydrogeniphilus]
MKEVKVYLGDWLYNAGIVGFLKIFEKTGDKGLIKINTNYISFSLDILKNFHERYFQYIYPQANKITSKISELQQLLSSEKIQEKDIQEVKRLTESSKILKEDPDIFVIIHEIKREKEIQTIKKLIQKLIEALYKHWEKYKDLYAKYYLLSFYEGKSIFNQAVKTKIKEKFKKDFIDPLFIFESQRKRKETVYCIVCNERIAKKDTLFDEGTFKVSGESIKECKNFYWNLNPNTPLCGLCELIYLCAFAGFLNLSLLGERNSYLFVNFDATVEGLYKYNKMLENFVFTSSDNPFKSIIRNILLDYQQKRSRWTLANILFVEFNTEKEPFAIYHFHVPQYIAKLFEEDNYKDFKGLENLVYKVDAENLNSAIINVLHESIDSILERRSLYPLINKVLHDFLNKKHNFSDELFNLVKIQRKLELFKTGRDEMREEISKKLWSLYSKGQDVAKELRNRNAENKIESIAYRLLSALRVKDKNTFYDTILRLYLNLNKDVPRIFLEALKPDNILEIESLGYAFLTGFLSKQSQENTEKEE